MSFAGDVDIESVSAAFKTLLLRRQRIEKALPMASESMKKIKERNWLKKREEIRKKMEDPAISEDELIQLAHRFDELTKNPPVIPSLLN